MEFDLNDQGDIGTRAHVLFLATRLFLNAATVLLSLTCKAAFAGRKQKHPFVLF